MVQWGVREELSSRDKIRRSYYELLRDDLDPQMLQYALIDSYCNFSKENIPYPFVEFRELKPRARVPDIEYPLQNAFLVIFVEDMIPSEHKKYIRFLDVNKTTKANLLGSKTLTLSGKFDRTHKYLDSIKFGNFLQSLLPVDYALLIQRDSATAKDRYSLSHFHVKIDWPISEAAEDLARNLRYISKDLYEKGDKQAEEIQKKYFEYYGLPFMAGGRRTAAIVAAQYLKRVKCITTVYAGSSESRSLIRISERGVSKSILIKLSEKELHQIAEANHIKPRTFYKNYVAIREKKYILCIFQATYNFTTPARPGDDGKLRDLNPDLHWLTVGAQNILPRPGVFKYPPIPLNIIYSETLKS
ncbi:MAG: hypothetical protein K9L30_17105 [Desulfobacterales bacterium]|nr:hypothetical protein [Desulfobacterales bacterium]